MSKKPRLRKTDYEAHKHRRFYLQWRERPEALHSYVQLSYNFDTLKASVSLKWG